MAIPLVEVEGMGRFCFKAIIFSCPYELIKITAFEDGFDLGYAQLFFLDWIGHVSGYNFVIIAMMKISCLYDIPK